MITEASKLEAVERELKMRRDVYGRRVEKGQMKQSWADYQIRIFEAIVEDYRVKAEGERLL